MNANELRSLLHDGERVVLGTCIVSPSTKWPLAIQNSKLDFVFIDTEHIALNRETVSWMCRTYSAMGIPPLVRIPTQDPDDATLVLDDGAAGVIVPYVEQPEVVRSMVGATKLRPLKGARVRDALKGEMLEPELQGYIESHNANHILLTNIESVPAMENLDQILAEKGLDCVLIGPHDLSTSLGVPEQYDHPRFLEACAFILGKARAAGIGAGIHHWLSPEKQMQFIEMGANLLIHKADAIFLTEGLQDQLREIRDLLGQNQESGSSVGVTI